MKIIIPMAGLGSRFKKNGLKTPKYALKIKGQTLFALSMLSLSDFFDQEFIFIYNTQNCNPDFIRTECETLGINKYQTVSINATTEGQASTVMMAENFIQSNDEVVIYNIDTYVEEGNILKSDLIDQPDGFLHSFICEGDKWSFVKTESDTSLKVIEVSEKIRISNLGTIGLYYFKSWNDFSNIYKSHKQEIMRAYNETYIAPMYKFLIQDDKKVYTKLIDQSNIHVLGTPDDIHSFYPLYLEENL